MEPKYKRILLKLSGEALAGDKKIGLDYDVITSFGKSIKKCVLERKIKRCNGQNKSRPYRYACNCYERTCCC